MKYFCLARHFWFSGFFYLPGFIECSSYFVIPTSPFPTNFFDFSVFLRFLWLFLFKKNIFPIVSASFILKTPSACLDIIRCHHTFCCNSFHSTQSEHAMESSQLDRDMIPTKESSPSKLTNAKNRNADMIKVGVWSTFIAHSLFYW